MSSQPNIDPGKRSLDRRSLVLGALAGAVGALCCVSLVAVTASGLFLGRWLNAEATKTPPKPSASLSVAADGCTVIRSEVEGGDPVRALQWVIVDESGRQVLARNAVGENRYTYFRPGKYDVVLQTFYRGGYVDISQHVKIECR